MARNEDGEFELMLGNKQLLSMFFLIVLLLALVFVGGYQLGRNTAPAVAAVAEPPQTVSLPPASEPAKAEAEPEAKATPPARTAPQAAVEDAAKTPEVAKETKQEPAAAPKEAAKAPPKSTAKTEPKQVAAAKSAPAAKPGPATSPVAGRTYLQLSATDKDKAEVMVDLLRRKNFEALAAPVVDRPGLFRVLVGPIADNAIVQTKAQLKAGGFPGDEAIRRVF